MPRTPLQYKKMKDERMLSIVEAALPLFAIYGEQSVSVDAISAKAKCSHGLVYHYFKDVHAIYESVISSTTNQELRETLLIPEKGQYAIKNIEHIVKVLLSAASDGISKICLCVMLINETGKDCLKITLEKCIKQGQKEGDVVGGNPADIANAFTTLLNGLYLPQIINKKANVETPSSDIVMRIFQKRS